MMLALVLVLVSVPMLVEARRSSRNEREQLRRGGVEPAGDVFPIMRLAYPAAFGAMIGEQAVRGTPPIPWVVFGLAVFAAAKALKWWAILTLGSFWTFRVIVVPGASLVAGGPYRLARHPNYIGVVGELAGIACMTGALVAGPVAIVVFAALLLKRIAVEERALRRAAAAAPDAILP